MIEKNFNCNKMFLKIKTKKLVLLINYGLLIMYR